MFILAFNYDQEISVGTTQAVIDAVNPGGMEWEDLDFELADTQFYYRVEASTTNTFGSPFYSTTQTQTVTAFWGIGVPTPFATNITVTSLTANQTYYYRLQVSNNGTTWTTVTSPATYGSFITPAAANPPNVSIAVSPSTGTAPITVIFTCTNTGGDVSSWKLDYGDGNSTTQAAYEGTYSPEYSLESLSHPKHYSTGGTYTATVTGTNADGTDTATVTVLLTTPTIVATYTYATALGTPNTLGHKTQTITLTDQSTLNGALPIRGPQRTWYVYKTGYATYSGSANPFEVTIPATNSAAGTWGVQLFRTDWSGLTGSVTVTNQFSHPWAVVNATFFGTDLLSGYSPLTVTFETAERGDLPEEQFNRVTGDGISATWSFGDGATSTATSTVTHTYTTAGQYAVTLTVTGSYGTATTSHSATRSDYVWVASPGTYHNLLGQLFRDVQWTLMCNPDLAPCEAFEEFGGVDNLVTIYYRRLREFLNDTGLLQVEGTLAADTAGVYPLPSDLIRLLRVEVDGAAVQAFDRKQADLGFPGWATSTSTEVFGYIIEPEESLSLQLVPKATGKTVKVLYVAAANTPSVPSDCLDWGVLPLPKAISWVVKWGMLADLLRQEGEMNDPVRAAFAQEVYDMGVALTKLLLYPGKGN